jgi:hypothetical protein
LRGDGPGSCDHGRAALVYVVELLTVVGGFALDLDLRGHGRSARAAHGGDLCRLRSYCDASAAPVVGDAGVVVDNDGAVIDIGDAGADAVDGAVVVEVVAVPVATVVADAGVAEAIVDAAVEADVKAPESAVESPTIVIPAPIAGSPEGAVIGGSAPSAGNPVVAGGAPIPVAGGPDVVGGGGLGLVVDGKGWRRLVGVLNRRSLTLFVELLGGLRVLIRLILIGWWRVGLLLRILGAVRCGDLLWLSLGSDSKNLSLAARGVRSSSLRLAVVDGCHVGSGGVRAGVVGSRYGVCGVGVAVATCRSDER